MTAHIRVLFLCQAWAEEMQERAAQEAAAKARRGRKKGKKPQISQFEDEGGYSDADVAPVQFDEGGASGGDDDGDNDQNAADKMKALFGDDDSDDDMDVGAGMGATGEEPGAAAATSDNDDGVVYVAMARCLLHRCAWVSHSCPGGGGGLNSGASTKKRRRAVSDSDDDDEEDAGSVAQPNAPKRPRTVRGWL